MVLEALMSVRDAIRKPWSVLLFSVGISLLALGVSYLIFPESAGLLSVFLITIISAPFMLSLLRYEEYREEREISYATGIWQKLNPIAAFFRQSQTFLVYSQFFVGVVIAMSLLFFVLPEKYVAKIFNDQISEIGKIGLALGGATSGFGFGQILVNNLFVMAVAFVLAILFGLGAVFILAWNASVLSAAIGLFAKGSVSGIPAALAAFLPHGVFEIAAYFISGIAGGIISVAVSKRKNRELRPVVGDMLVMMILSVALVVVGAFIESF